MLAHQLELEKLAKVVLCSIVLQRIVVVGLGEAFALGGSGQNEKENLEIWFLQSVKDFAQGNFRHHEGVHYFRYVVKGAEL